jgi:hypothetical protein
MASLPSLSSLWPFGSSGPPVMQIPQHWATDLYDRARDSKLRMQTIRPYKGTEGDFERAMTLLSRLYSPSIRVWGLSNRSLPMTFELHYTDDTELLQPRIVTQSDEQFDLVNRQVQSIYPDSTTREVDSAFLDIQPGQYVAGEVLQLRQQDEINRLRPIKNYRVDGEGFEIDPIQSIGREMVGSAHHANCDVLTQMVMKPAVSEAGWDKLNWWSGIDQTIEAVTGDGDGQSMDWGEIGWSLVEPLQQIGLDDDQRRRRTRRRRRQRDRETGGYSGDDRFTKGSLTEDSIPSRSPLAKILDKQRGMLGYHLCIRIIAVSDDPDAARQRVENTARMFRSFYNSQFQQGFEPGGISQRTLYELLDRAAERRFTDRQMTFPVDTLAGVCKIPLEIDLQQYDYSMSALGIGVPPRTPRYDWAADGLDRATASKAKRQHRLLVTTDPAKPIYYGFGMKNEVEAGVEPEVLSVHQFVGGSTGNGKTTLLINFFFQIMQRGHGGLFFDPKGQDADKIVKILPEHRTDDLVFIDIGADAEYEVGFNFLEIPLDDPNPESKAFDSATGALASDLESLLAQSGGENSQWGSRMSGVTRAVVRGLCEHQVRTDTPVTILDMAYLIADDEGRDYLHQMMVDERIEWIKQATDVIADYDQSDLEPLYRRLWEWMFSRTIRSVASHPHTTVSIDDLVRDGKIVVVRNRSSDDTAQRLIATALIRRLWVAVREQSNRDDEPAPPPFFVVCDEFDKIVSEHSDIHNILRQARSFDFSLTLAAQNLDTGGGDDVGIPESIQKAIRGNCKTFLTFNPGEDDATGIARQHSTNVTAEEISELSKYRIYMRTTDDRGDLTDSYKVGAFPPAEEALEDVRSDEEAKALIQASQERYGQPPRSDEEIRDELLMDGTSSAGRSDSDGGRTDALALTDERRRAVSEAILDEACTRDNDNGAVTVETCRDRIRAYHDAGEALEDPSQIDALLDKMPTGEEDGHIERWEDENEDIWLRTTSTGKADIFYTGNSPTSGGLKHRELLKDSYEPLIKLGGRVTLPEQSGETMPDGWLSLGETELADVDADARSEQAHQAVMESFVAGHPLLSRLALGRATVTEPGQATGEDFPTESVASRGIALEAERSTGKSNPFQTCLNVARVINNGQRCLLLCRPGTGEKVWKTLTAPPFYSQYSDPESPEQILYNGSTLTIGDEQMLRPAGGDNVDNVWRYDTETGEYICGDSDGTVFYRFDSAQAVFENTDAYPATRSKNDDVPDRLATIKIPFIVERMFKSGEIPDRDRWDIIEVPPGATDPAELALYEEGQAIPFDEWREAEQTTREDVLAALSSIRENGTGD